MTDTSSFFTTGQTRDVPRDQWGRYKLPDADGTTSGWTRATTFAEALTEQFGLSIYQQNQVVVGLGLRPDLLSLASTIDPTDKRALGEIRKSAHESAATDAKANRGTAIHAACALVERHPAFATSRMSAVDAAPLEFRGHVLSYLSALDSAGLRIDPRYVECTVIVPQYHVAGTADNFVLCPDGRYRVLDKKTGNLDYAAIEFAVQLALYANAKAIRDYDNNRYLPMPENLATDYGIIAHIDPDTGLTELYRVNIAWGWMVARLCAEVRDARQQKHVLTPYVVDVGLTAPRPQLTVTPSATPLPVPNGQRVQLPPSPIQQATTTAVDSFWSQPFDDEDDDQGPPPFVAAGPPAPPVSAAPPAVADGPKLFTDPNGVQPPFEPGASAAPAGTASAPQPDSVPPIPADGDLGAVGTEAFDVDSAADDVVHRCKSKARVQQFAREVMQQASIRSGTVITDASADGVKLNQQQIKIARAVLELAVKWGVDWASMLPEPTKPRRKATAEDAPAPDLKLKMIRTAPTHQTLIEYKERLTAENAWTPDYESAASVRWAEIEQQKSETVPAAAQGEQPIGVAEMISGATSPQTIQMAWRRVTDNGQNVGAWEEHRAAAEAKMLELNPPT